MLFWIILKVSLKSLLNNKLRTLLSMLGIVIGVGAVIAMLALGKGAQAQVLARVTSMGTNLLVLRPGQSGMSGVNTGTQQNLRLQDAEQILNRVDSVSQVAPVVGGSVQLKHLDRNTRTNLVGTAVTYFPIRNFKIQKGRSFTDEETTSMARLAVLGPVTASDLFGEENPLDQSIKLNGINFRVIGILKAKGDQGYFNPDDEVVIPYSTAMKQVLGVDYVREIDVEVDTKANLNNTQELISEQVRQQHHTQPGSPDDFNIRNQAEFLETASSVTQTFTLLLGGIASISLLVGGIGIMNIMLVTVTERTREIGIRKAIGARNGDILRQFMLEAVIISSVGGTLGVGLGLLGAVFVTLLSPYQAQVELWSIFLALGFSMAIGIFFGYYPAFRASRLNPIDCLRYE